MVTDMKVRFMREEKMEKVFITLKMVTKYLETLLETN